MRLPITKGRIPVTMIVLSLLTTLMFSALPVARAQEYVAPEAAAGETYYAAFPITVAVDGNLAEWAAVPYATFTDGPQPSPNPAQDGTVSFAAVADAQNLYFSVLVTDATIIAGQHGAEYWNEDSVEIYINATGNLDLTAYAPGVAQITIPAVNIGLPREQTRFAGVNWEAARATAVVVATPTGYAIEASVPLVTDQWNITPVQDGVLGFQVQLNGASQPEARDIKLSWSNRDKVNDQSHANPSVFGRLAFSQVGDVAPVPPPAPTATPAEVVDGGGQTGGFTVDGAAIYDPNGNLFV